MSDSSSGSVSLSACGINASANVHFGLSSPAMVELALTRKEAQLTQDGALVALTGSRTGRSPKDRFVVRDGNTDSQVNWGPVNQPVEPEVFERIRRRVVEHLQRQELFICDGEACADSAHRLRVRVVAERAWHALFAHCLFLRPDRAKLHHFRPDWHVLAAPECQPDPDREGHGSKVFVGLDFTNRLVIIAGTHYAGEIKKSIFSVLNYLLPQKDVFPMHCSANVGTKGDVALFFGLSGTGKTTLSADPHRRLIGDDEHGWSSEGVFNIEGGCYAKTVGLTRQGEPQIWDAIRFGSVLENVVIDPVTRIPDFADIRITENTRAAYPVEFIPNCELSGRGGHPNNIFFLTCDAFGVLPAMARLTAPQAMFHFLAGYTAKVAGTETGITEPESEFSTCFAAPFLPLHPTRYAEMLRQKMEKHRCSVWLVNTGWTRGPYGVGHRIHLKDTRNMLRAALEGSLEQMPFEADPIFGFEVPRQCPDVPDYVFKPRTSWQRPERYDAQANRLAQLFREKFAPFADRTTEAVRNAMPKVK
jgi:phosphoenolpyruvate carboxykinase (ATP)